MDTAQTVASTRSTGRVPSPVVGMLLVVEAMWTWYKRNWRSTVISTMLLPVLFLVALGLGFGSQVQPGPATLGLTYVEYLAPALMVATAMQTASFESTYPILSSFKWQQTYFAVIATPVGATQIAGGQLLWIAARLVFSSAVFLVIAGFLGALTGPGVLLSLPVAVLTAMALSALIVAYAATIESEGQQFNVIFRFVVMPMTMFAGTYFPVEQLPGWVRPLVWLTPLWHGTELSRALAFGNLELWADLGHLAYLVAMLAVGVYLTRRNFVRRLAI